MLPFLDPDDKDTPFPPLELALEEPDGLLAAGGDLSPERLLRAYRAGIFPWYNPGEPILWWSPNPRAVLYLEDFHASRSLKKSIRKRRFHCTFDMAFAEVMQACAAPRDDQPGTWITSEMYKAYVHLHELGYAHSVETWCDDELVGGLYGINIGHMFFGESMFSRQTDASKAALKALVEALEDHGGYQMIDCQVASEHLVSLGAIDIDRADFAEQINKLTSQEREAKSWQALNTNL